MSHGKLRTEKDCLNCGQIVEDHFCGHCGQENVEPRQPFHYLFTHFFEDFTHYDGQFWGTLKNLIFKPGKLTTVYLEGKRQKFVPPVKLYIFVSFITFLIPSFLPNSTTSVNGNFADNTETIKTDSVLNPVSKKKEIDLDSLLKNDSNFQLSNQEISIGEAKNKAQFDSLYTKHGLYFVTKPLIHKLFDLKEKGYTNRELYDKFVGALSKAFPKALFVYLPIFAFLLWSIHNKKLWWYFDHGVFTLHYFSYLLLASLIYLTYSSIIDNLDWGWLNVISSVISIVLFIYSVSYFFMAHKMVYKNSKSKTITKGIVLFIVNHVLIFFTLSVLVYFSFLSIK